MTTVDHVTCCCTETRETIQRLEAAYGAACQRLTETEAALVEVTGERDRARDLAVRLWDEGPGEGPAENGRESGPDDEDAEWDARAAIERARGAK